MSFVALCASIFSDVWKIAQENMSAIGLLLFNYEEYKIDRARRDKEAIELELQLQKNKESIDEKYRDKSDLDVVQQSVIDGGGTASDIAEESGGSPTTEPAAASDHAGQTGSQGDKKD